MDVILYGDLFKNVVINFLLPIDLYNLTLTCKVYSKIITMRHVKQLAINEINRRLRSVLGSDYNNFVNLMQKNNMAISGSFIIQCILGVNWPDSDIDVYVNDADTLRAYSYDYHYYDEYGVLDTASIVNKIYPPNVQNIVQKFDAKGRQLDEPDIYDFDAKYIQLDEPDLYDMDFISDTESDNDELPINRAVNYAGIDFTSDIDTDTDKMITIGNDVRQRLAPLNEKRRKAIEIMASNNIVVHMLNKYKRIPRYTVCRSPYRETMDDLFKIIDLNVNGTCMQFIIFPIYRAKDKIDDYILEKYDYDICKNIYRHNNLYIHNIGELFNRCTCQKNITDKNYTFANLLRHLKYSQRGFTFYQLIDNYKKIVQTEDIYNLFKTRRIEIKRKVDSIEKYKIDLDKIKYCLIRNNNMYVTIKRNNKPYAVCIYNMCADIDTDNAIIPAYKNKDVITNFVHSANDSVPLHFITRVQINGSFLMFYEN